MGKKHTQRSHSLSYSTCLPGTDLGRDPAQNKKQAKDLVFMELSLVDAETEK